MGRKSADLFCSFLVDGGWDALVYSNILANTFYELIGNSLNSVVVINVIFSLILVHIMLFVLGFLLGWIGFGFKRAGCAKAAAVLYLFATILFPVFIFLGLPLIILGFVGYSNQKKLISAQFEREKQAPIC